MKQYQMSKSKVQMNVKVQKLTLLKYGLWISSVI